MKAALLKQKFDQNSQKNCFDDSNNDKFKQTNKFALQCFNNSFKIEKSMMYKLLILY